MHYSGLLNFERSSHYSDRQKAALAYTSNLIWNPEGVDEAIRRAELYLGCGADGVYVEGPRNVRAV